MLVKNLLVFVCLMLLSSPALAQQDEAASAFAATRAEPKPDDTWSVTIYGKQLFESGLFDQIVMVVLGEESREVTALMERYQEVIGLDPRQDIESLQLTSSTSLVELTENFGDDDIVMKHAAKSVVHAKLKTLGNLEGLLLAAPGYQEGSKTPAGRLHKVSIENFSAQIHFGKTGNVVAGSDPNLVVKAIGHAAEQSETASSPSDELFEPLDSPTSNSVPAPTAARVVVNGGAIKNVLEFPGWQQTDDYALTVIRRVLTKLQHAEANLTAESGGAMNLDATLSAANEDDASQIAQLLKASVAMLKLMITEEGAGDPEVIPIKKLADELDVSHSGRQVKVKAKVDNASTVMMLLTAF